MENCDGCEKRCEFGYSIEEYTVYSDGVALHYEVTYPTVAGKTIKSYLDRFVKCCHTGAEIVNGKISSTMQPANVVWREIIREGQQEQAYEIARLCDHYKTR